MAWTCPFTAAAPRTVSLLKSLTGSCFRTRTTKARARESATNTWYKLACVIWTRTSGNEGSRGIDTEPQQEEPQGDTNTKQNETKLTAYAYVDSRPVVREQDGGDMTDPRERRKRGCTCHSSRASVCHFNAYIVPFSCLLVEVHEQAAPQLVHEPGQEADVTPSRGAVDRQLAARTGGDATYGTIREGGR